MRGKQLTRLPDATVALVCHTVLTCLCTVDASGSGDLSDGQIAGVVIGSVGGALLLGLLGVLVCCLRGSRLRQTGDLTWAKAVDLEAVAMAQTPHQPLSGPCEADVVASAQRGVSGATTGAGGGDDSGGRSACVDNDASFDGNARTDISTVTGEGHSNSAAGAGIDPAVFPSFPPSPCSSQQRSSGRKIGFFRGRSVGSNVGNSMAQFFVVHKGLLRNSNGNMKDKHLQVSRSARVEPSAEVEMAEPFQPAETNMGPPLSKSSMLLRWLNGADEGLPDTAVAAQLAAATAAANKGPAGRLGDLAGSGGRGGRGSGAGGGRGGAMAMSLDRLPLLSLAAQQTGIVWSKMPASVASSPAVSQAEGSSVHMLRGTWKRSDAPGEAAVAAGNPAAATALAAWHGGDDRYPASLGQASLGSFSQAGAARRSAAGAGMSSPGIVFDYVLRANPSPSSSRTHTGGGASSRAPTIGGGAVLPVSSSGGGADRLSSGGGAGGFGGDDAFTMGAIPDDQMLAQALHRGSPSPGQDTTTPRVACGRPWLHQTPPTKLTALQEEDDDATEVIPSPLPRPSLQSSTAHVLPAASPLSPLASPGPGLSPPLTHSGGQSPLTTPGMRISPPPTPAGAPSPGPNSPLPVATSEASSARVSEQVSVRPGWTHFGDGEEALHSRSTCGPFVHGAVRFDPASAAGSLLNPEPPLPLTHPSNGSSAGTAGVADAVQGARPLSPFLPAAGVAAAVAAGSSTIDCARVSASQVAADYADKDLPDVADVSSAHSARGPRSASAASVPGIDRSASAGARVGNDGAAGAGVFMVPGRRPTDIAIGAAPPGGAPRASPLGSATPSQRRGAPPPLLPSQSDSSLRSQTSLVSPSLSIHYPDVSEGLSAEGPSLYCRPSIIPGPLGSAAADSAAPTPGGDRPGPAELAREPAAVSVGSATR